MLFEAFKRLRDEHPSAPAFLVSSGDRFVPITWRQFTDDISLVSHLVRAHADGGKVALLGENSYEWMVAHAAIVFSGATAVSLDVNLSPEEIAERLRFVGAVALIHSSLYAEKAKATGRLAPGVVIAGFGSIKTERFLGKIRAAIPGGASDDLWDQSAPLVDTAHATSMIVFTSGTTSKPRGVELTLASVETFCEWTGTCLPMKPGDHSIMLLPLYHIFGLSTTYLMLAKGVALGVCPDFRRIYDVFERFRVSFAFLVPALAEILAGKIAQHGASAEEATGCPIDWILVGGAPLLRRTYEKLRALGVRAITGYGLTETAAAYAMTPFAADAPFGAQGVASRARGVETKVSDAGELMIKGPCVMKGYYRDAEATRRVLDADGWFHTGDIGRMDENGFVYVTGRASRTIVLSSGKKVAPEEIEEKLLSLPGILESRVTGEGETREIRAEVYASTSEESARRVIAALNLRLPVYQRISKVVVRKEPFPRTSSGKIKVEKETR